MLDDEGPAKARRNDGARRYAARLLAAHLSRFDVACRVRMARPGRGRRGPATIPASVAPFNPRGFIAYAYPEPAGNAYSGDSDPDGDFLR